MPIDMSVVIPTFQRRDSLKRALDAFQTQNFPADRFEVIVSIDGSSDGTCEMVDDYASPYPLAHVWQANQGRAAACNSGISRSVGEIIVILDDDMQPDPNFLTHHWKAHQETETLGILGSVPVRMDQTTKPVTRYMGEKFNQHLVRLNQTNNTIQLRDFYTGNFSIRREHLLASGLFDEAFRVYGNEDLELFCRLRQHGVQMKYCAEALAYQYYEKDFPTIARDHFEKGQTANLLARKHPEVYSEIKLSTYQQSSARWRLVMSALIKLSWRGSLIPSRVIQGVGWLEKRNFSKLNLIYRFCLDYFFWLGSMHVEERALLH